MRKIIDELYLTCNTTDENLRRLIEDDSENEYLRQRADEKRRSCYGTEVYIRGLIEISNYCKNDCLYCGIRCSNKNATRYRLTKEQIIECADIGYSLGFRTFVMQGGEDGYYTDDLICEIIGEIKEKYPDCAVTLSLGEKSYESYKKYFDSGADRYLLRHETANVEHYSKLHPQKLSAEKRKRCLFDLKKIGYQVGSGFMVGSPYQTTDNLVEDLRFLQKLKPDMIGIGPFIHHNDTPFADFKDGSAELTIKMISILRLMFPYALIPATTALGTLDTRGREKGIMAGANVVMPNLSPVSVRKLYDLYSDKICTGEEAAECRACLEKRIESVGYKIVVARGDVKKDC